jgi:hypothetical protein
MRRSHGSVVIAALALVSMLTASSAQAAPGRAAAADVFTHNLALTTANASGVTGVVSTRYVSLPQKTWLKLDVRHLTPGGAYVAVLDRKVAINQHHYRYHLSGRLNLTTPDRHGCATGMTWVRGYIWGAHAYVVAIHRTSATGPLVASATLP